MKPRAQVIILKKKMLPKVDLKVKIFLVIHNYNLILSDILYNTYLIFEVDIGTKLGIIFSKYPNLLFIKQITYQMRL